MLNNIIERVKFLFREDKELYSSLKDIIGYYPHNIEYFKQALMHKSVAKRNSKGKPINNERLEFLGDAILDAAVGHIVYKHFPGKREGFLTDARSKLVKRETLNRLANEMGLTQLIVSSGKSFSHNSYMAGNAFEALVGAIYLDRGYYACMRFLEKQVLEKRINIDRLAYKEVNFKSKLLEWCQKNKVELEFLLEEQKRDQLDNPMFNFVAIIESIKCCVGTGYSKKESQQDAAKQTLALIKKQPQLIEAIFAAKRERLAKQGTPEEVVFKENESAADNKQTGSQNDENATADATKNNADTRKTSHYASFLMETNATEDADSGNGKQRANARKAAATAKQKEHDDIVAAAEEAAFAEQ